MPFSDIRLESNQFLFPSTGFVTIKIPEKTGSIITNTAAESSTEGFIAAIGYNAFSTEQPGFYKIGDRVTFTRFSSFLFIRWIDESHTKTETFAIVSERDITGKIADESAIVFQGTNIPGIDSDIEIDEGDENEFVIEPAKTG